MHSEVLVKLDIKNPTLEKRLQQIIHSVEGLQVLDPRDPRLPDLVILELENDTDRDLQLVQAQVDQGAVGEVFLTSSNPDSAVLVKALRMGVKEFLAQPIHEDDVRLALERCKKRREQLREKLPGKLGQIISVIGSKGGVGTTTVAVNLAVSLAERKPPLSVALIDMNLVLAEIPLFLEIKPRYHWGEVAKNIYRLDPAFLMNILVKHDSGVYVLPSPTYLEAHKAATPEIITRLLGLMKTMFDFLIIDGGHPLGDLSLTTLQMSDRVLLVSILSLPCLANTNKLSESFQELGYPEKSRIKVIINRYLKNSEISLKNAEQSIRQSIFWTIPNDYRTTMAAINQGKVLSQIASGASVTKNLRSLAALLVEGESPGAKKRWSILRPWQSKKDSQGGQPVQ